METKVKTCKSKSVLTRRQTEAAILLIKSTFEENLIKKLHLEKVSAPLAVKAGTGINDDLNGVEKPVSFSLKNAENIQCEVVQSLAKWKRLRLKELSIEPGNGILTNMQALRPDETLSLIHSIYVDQWDWEVNIDYKERNIELLKETVNKIYAAIKESEMIIYEEYPRIYPKLPDKIHFIHAEELRKRYPDKSPIERENAITKKHKAVFVIGIGYPLGDGEPHDGRAPDYDDWSSENDYGSKGLNGDILLWNPELEKTFEISSMGIRVDKTSLIRQLKLTGCEEWQRLYFHKQILNYRIPNSIGGGIGQSRLCMFLLKKAHIGEVQPGIWPDWMTKKYNNMGINLL
ncbi:MAG: aspartate--ammonia ligase [Bacteroidales bacterium]